MRFERILKGSSVVVAFGLLVALARSGGLFTPLTDWQTRQAIEQARDEDARLRELERQAELEPRLAPVLMPARASVEARRQRLALEASELAFEGAQERFEESRRQATEGQALVDSATSLFGPGAVARQ